MHNTQPWRLLIKDAGSRIEMFADPARMLPVSDERGRAVYIACGAALFNLRMAAAEAGLRAQVRVMPDEGKALDGTEPLFVAEVELSAGYVASPWERELCAAIPRRHTNREPYASTPLPPAIRAELAEGAKSQGAILHFLDDDETARVRHLAADAERELLDIPAYRAELARWVSKDRAGDGIPIEALGPRSATGRDPVRDFDPDRHDPVRYATFEEYPQLAVLSLRPGGGGAEPGPVEWIAAGQALERVWLTATCRDVCVCPLTQALETGDAWLITDTRWGFEYPQMIMRVGYGPPVRATTPRRAAADVTGDSAVDAHGGDR